MNETVTVKAQKKENTCSGYPSWYHHCRYDYGK